MYVVTCTISLDNAILESLDWRLRCCYNNEIFILVTGEVAIKKWYPLYLHLAFQLSSLKHTRLFVTGWANFQHRGAFHLIAWPIRPEFLSPYQWQNLVCIHVSQISSEKEPHSNFIYIFRLDIYVQSSNVLCCIQHFDRFVLMKICALWLPGGIPTFISEKIILLFVSLDVILRTDFIYIKWQIKKILDLFNLLDPVKCHAVLKSKPITA
jgi:hypothetical protein